jgi:hypothetical protein
MNIEAADNLAADKCDKRLWRRMYDYVNGEESMSCVRSLVRGQTCIPVATIIDFQIRNNIASFYKSNKPR